MKKILIILALLVLSPMASAQQIDVYWTSDSDDWTSNENCGLGSHQDVCYVTQGDRGIDADFWDNRRLSRHMFLCLFGTNGEQDVCRWHLVEARIDNYRPPEGFVLGQDIDGVFQVFSYSIGSVGPDPWNMLDPWCLHMNCINNGNGTN